MFVTLNTLDDILPHITLGDGINLVDRGDYQVLDYNFIASSVFTNDYALECRGLKFAADGKLIARPLHKFFNLGERDQMTEVDFTQPHVVFDKLDGTMVHPVMLNGDLVFMTRAGLTRHAQVALAAAPQGVLDLCVDAMARNLTPVFEFTAPDNRIVIAYDRPQITLLAARDITTGAYLTHDALVALGQQHGVPLPQLARPVADVKAFVADTRGLPDVEGYVIAFDDGRRIKIKTDSYVLRHRALSGLKMEKNVVAWIAEQMVDDVLPLLRPGAADALQQYADTVEANMARQVADLQAFFDAHKTLPDRKSYALAVKDKINPRLSKVAFGMLDGGDAATGVRAILQWASGGISRPDDIRFLLGTEWHPPDGDYGTD